MNKKIIWGVVVLIVVLILVGFNKDDLNEDYAIGAIVPLSGGAANIGVPFSIGMRMAVDDINATGGINGKSVILAVEDGEFSGTKTVSSAQNLLNSLNPDVFSVLFALPAQAVGPVFEQAQKPFLEWDYSRDLVDTNPFAFKTGFDAKSGCADLLSFAKNQNLYKKIGILMSKTPYNQECYESLKTVDVNISEYWYEVGSSDFRTLLSKANNDGVDMLVSILIDPEPIQIFKQIDELGYSIKLMCFTSSECIYPAVEESVSQKTLEGTIALEFIPLNIFGSDFSKRFVNETNNKYGNVGVVWAAQGYDDATIMINSMKNCKAKDSSCLIKELKKVKNYDSLIESNGFTDRVQNLEMRKQMYTEGAWIDIGI